MLTLSSAGQFVVALAGSQRNHRALGERRHLNLLHKVPRRFMLNCQIRKTMFVSCMRRKRPLLSISFNATQVLYFLILSCVLLYCLIHAVMRCLYPTLYTYTVTFSTKATLCYACLTSTTSCDYTTPNYHFALIVTGSEGTRRCLCD